MTDTRLQVEPFPLLGERQATHEVCCLDETTTTGRLSMCGLPIPDGELDLDSDPPSCVVCQDLIYRWARNVEQYGAAENPRGPGAAPCRLCPRRNKAAADD